MKTKKLIAILALAIAASAWADTWTDPDTGITWRYTVSNGEASLAAIDTTTEGALIIPSSLGGYPVTQVSWVAFRGCRGLTSVTIPNSVTSIGSGAFSGCSGLTSVAIPDSVTSIGYGAFSDCNKIRDISVPQCVLDLQISNVFSAYSSITNVAIPDSVTSIGDYAFNGCRNLASIIIPDSVTSIGYGAFDGCTGLRNVTIPQYVCSSRMASVFPGVYYSITNVVVSDSVTSIGYGTFFDCTGLASVTMPDSVTNIERFAFKGCCSLADSEGFIVINGVVYDYSGDASEISIPETVKCIHDWAFEDCIYLESLTISCNVTNIGAKAFINCDNLRQLVFADDGVVGILPKPRKVDHKFIGWFTSEDGGEELTAGCTVHAGDIFYARWSEMEGFTIASFDLDIPDTITVCDDNYRRLDKQESDVILAVYDPDGDMIDKDLVYISSIERTDGGSTSDSYYSYWYSGYYNSIDSDYSNKRYLRAGEYVVSIVPQYYANGTGSAERTVTIEKMNYGSLPPDYSTPQLWGGFTSHGGYIYDYSSGVYDTGEIAGEYDSDIEAEIYAIVPPISGSLPDISLSICKIDESSGAWDEWTGYTTTPSSSHGVNIRLNSAGLYEIQVDVPGYDGEDNYGYGFVNGWSGSIRVYVSPRDISRLPVSITSDLVYTGEEIVDDNNSSDLCFFGDKVRVAIEEETPIFIKRPEPILNAGLYALSIGVEQEYHSNATYPPTGGVIVEENSDSWLLLNPDATVQYAGITGSGGWCRSGLTNLFFRVASRPVYKEQLEVMLPNLTYDGAAKICQITITNDYNGAILQEGVDYDVEYVNNVNPGTATVTVTCKGNYTGTFAKEFTIAPVSFNLSAGEGGGFGGESGNIAGYEGEYDGEGHGLTVNVDALNEVTVKYAQVETGPYSSVAPTFTNVCNKTVWVELSAFGYNSFTGSVQVVISPRSIANATITAVNSVDFAGGVPQLTYSVYDSGLAKALVKGKDYTATIANDEAEGVTTVTVSGKGNYDGVAQTTTLYQRSIATFGISLSQETFFYNGEAKRPVVTVTDPVHDAVLRRGIDFTVAYLDNIDVGTASVTVTGKGNYTGSQTLYYTIEYPILVKDGATWQYVAYSDRIEMVSVDGIGAVRPSVVVVPDEIEGLPVVRLPDEAFGGWTSLKTVVFGRNMLNLGSNPFGSCISLKSVVFLGDAPQTAHTFTDTPPGLMVYVAKDSTGWSLVGEALPEYWPEAEIIPGQGYGARAIAYIPSVEITPKSGVKSGRVNDVRIEADTASIDATIRYTLDGSDPTETSSTYKKRFSVMVTELVTIKAAMFVGSALVGDVTTVKYAPDLNDVINIGAIVAKEGSAPLAFALDGDNPWWSDETETSFDGTPSMKSGKLSEEGGTSWMSATFTGAGKFEFWWRASCERDESGTYEYDHAICELDGEEVRCIDGETDWEQVLLDVETEGEHTITWTYFKDDELTEGEDCVWVDGVKFSYPVTVSFAIGDAVGNTPEPIISAVGYTVTLPGDEDIVLSKHTFGGWSDGEAVYPGGVKYEVGATNTTLSAVWEPKVLAAPTIDVAAEYDEESTLVSICAVDGAVVYYTIDGSEPDEGVGTIYTTPFLVAGTTTIKAVATADDWFASAVETAVTTRSWTSLEECLGAVGFTLATGGDANWIGDVAEGCVKTAANAGGWLTATFTGPGVATYLLREGAGEWVRYDEVFVEDGEHVLRWEGEDLAVKGLEIMPVVTVSFAADSEVVGEIPQAIYTAEGREVELPGGDGLSKPKHAFDEWRFGEDVYLHGQTYVVGAEDVEFLAAWAPKVLSAPVIEAPSAYEAESATVVISAEVGTEIHYAIDGSVPTGESALYGEPFEVSGSAVVKAIAIKDDWFDSEVAVFRVKRMPWTLGECLNAPKLTFETDSENGWARVKDVSRDGYAVRSGHIADKETTELRTTVDGTGTISFWCKVSSEADGSEVYDGLVLAVDGVEVTDLIGGEIGWTNVTFAIEIPGEHVIAWRYEKDKRDFSGEDCAWLDEVVWTPKPAAPVVNIDKDKMEEPEVDEESGTRTIAVKGNPLEDEAEIAELIEQVTVSVMVGSEPVDTTAGYNKTYNPTSNTIVITLKEPEVGAEEVAKVEDDATGVLADMSDEKVELATAEPEPTIEETAAGNTAVAALPVNAVKGLYYQASWGSDLSNMRQGEKVQATGDTLYLGVIKQRGTQGFYKVTVSEQ